MVLQKKSPLPTPPIIQYVNLLLEEAIRQQASDLHLEPFETACHLRYRIDGCLMAKKPLPHHLAAPLISRLKLLAQLDITEQRLPQDGRLQHTYNQTTVDFRLSTLPTPFGESLVLRVLDRRNVVHDLSSLHLPPVLYEGIKTILHQPHGLFVVTGPTGAGKTTTLYACLQELQKRHLKILTAEDPVEYEVEGIMQVPIQEAIGRSFPQLLRSFLRHDPDVIMIGETRDIETAQMGMQAALTGHLVFTTLHTTDTAGAIARLLDMGIDPTLIATTLQGVLAQRLVRKICPSCRTTDHPDRSLLRRAHAPMEQFENKTFYVGRGCDDCQQTGYHGRIGLFELLLINDNFRLLIHQRLPPHELRKKAIAAGMITLRTAGWHLVQTGITTLEEMLATTPDG